MIVGENESKLLPVSLERRDSRVEGKNHPTRRLMFGRRPFGQSAELRTNRIDGLAADACCAWATRGTASRDSAIAAVQKRPTCA